jgi:UDP-N-acetyl-D-mannosaminuronic acid dehydrogenase
LRESPAVEIVRLLREEGYDVTQYDPLIEGMDYHSLVEIARGTDLIAVLVPHQAMVTDLVNSAVEIEQAMRTPIIRYYQ